MSNTKELIQKYYNAFKKHDMDAFLNYLTDDVIHDINQGETEVGKEAFANFMDHMNKCYKETVKDLVIMVNENGSRAAAEFIIEGEYMHTDGNFLKAKGQKYSLPVGAFFSLKNGKIARVTNYYNLQNWLKQVER